MCKKTKDDEILLNEEMSTTSVWSVVLSFSDEIDFSLAFSVNNHDGVDFITEKAIQRDNSLRNFRNLKFSNFFFNFSVFSHSFLPQKKQEGFPNFHYSKWVFLFFYS